MLWRYKRDSRLPGRRRARFQIQGFKSLKTDSSSSSSPSSPTGESLPPDIIGKYPFNIFEAGNQEMDDTKWKDGKRIGKNGDLEVRSNTSLITAHWARNAYMGLYKSLCWLVGRLVRWSVRLSVRPSVTLCVFQCFNKF